MKNAHLIFCFVALSGCGSAVTTASSSRSEPDAATPDVQIVSDAGSVDAAVTDSAETSVDVGTVDVMTGPRLTLEVLPGVSDARHMTTVNAMGVMSFLPHVGRSVLSQLRVRLVGVTANDRVWGTRGSSYFSNFRLMDPRFGNPISASRPGLPLGDTPNRSGWIALETSEPFVVDANPSPIGVRRGISIVADVGDVEDLDGEFTTQPHSYYLEFALPEIRDLETGRPLTGSDIELVSSLSAEPFTILPVDVAPCGPRPEAWSSSFESIRLCVEGETSCPPDQPGMEEYELAVRPLGRTVITAGVGAVVEYECPGCTTPSANRRSGVFISNYGPVERQLLPWLVCERRRGHYYHMRYSFRMPGGHRFGVAVDMMGQNVDTGATFPIRAGNLEADGASCGITGASIIVDRVTHCDTAICFVPVNLAERHEPSIIHPNAGMPWMTSGCFMEVTR